MLGKLFKKKEKQENVTVFAPISGELVSLEEVPDPVFGQKMMGDGVAIKPDEGELTAPFDGKVLQVFPTKHAIGLEAANGAEILIHIGLETVAMSGEGFTSHVKEGDKIHKGDKLISFDLALVEQKAQSTIIPIIVTNTDNMSEIKKGENRRVTRSDEILFIKNSN